MSDIQQRFEKAVEQVRGAPADGDFKPSQSFQLKMYGLYRQATDGDVSGKKPSLINPVARLKYQAWESNRGMSQQDAMTAYIEEVDAIAAKYA